MDSPSVCFVVQYGSSTPRGVNIGQDCHGVLCVHLAIIGNFHKWVRCAFKFIGPTFFICRKQDKYSKPLLYKKSFTNLLCRNELMIDARRCIASLRARAQVGPEVCVSQKSRKRQILLRTDEKKSEAPKISLHAKSWRITVISVHLSPLRKTYGKCTNEVPKSPKSRTKIHVLSARLIGLRTNECLNSSLIFKEIQSTYHQDQWRVLRCLGLHFRCWVRHLYHRMLCSMDTSQRAWVWLKIHGQMKLGILFLKLKLQLNPVNFQIAGERENIVWFSGDSKLNNCW